MPGAAGADATLGAADMARRAPASQPPFWLCGIPNAGAIALGCRSVVSAPAHGVEVDVAASCAQRAQPRRFRPRMASATARPSTAHAPNARLPAWVLTGAFLGIVAGLVLGERTAVLRPIGIAYSMMLESVVYPYLLSSLIAGLGGLTRVRAARLLRASWAPYLFIWVASFAVIFALRLAIPAAPPPIEISGAAGAGGVSLVTLLIPANITAALGQNYVPAVVIFAVAFGVAIQTVERKGAFLETIEVVRRASLAIWGWVVYLAPLGVFALFASTAGTIEPELAETLSVYLCLFLIGTAVLAFVVLPMALSAIAPASAAEIVAELRPALVLAVVTTLSVSALPFVQSAAERVTARAGIEGEEADDVIRATLSLSYVFTQVGNYFIALFILYAGYRYHADLDAGQLAALPLMTLLSGIGSPSATVDGVQFLTTWLRLPPEAVGLYIESMAVTRYGQVVVSVVAFGFATIAVPLVYFRVGRWRPTRLGAGIGLGMAILTGVILVSRGIDAWLFPPPTGAATFARTLSPAVTEGVEATVRLREDPPPPPIDGPATLEGIRQRGVLRVGYGHDIVPFSYFNAKGDLVGFDVSHAYRLAGDLHVRLEFVPVDWRNLTRDLQQHRFDIVMAGAYATDLRLQALEVTDPYFVSPLALIARSDRARELLSYAEIAARPDLTLGVFDDPVLTPLVSFLFPKAKVVTLGSYDELPDHPEITAAIWSLDQARAWAAGHPGFTAVEPANMGSPLVFAYLLPPTSSDVAQFVDLWLELRARDGFRDREESYWIKGRPRAGGPPRWNLLDALLGRDLGAPDG